MRYGSILVNLDVDGSIVPVVKAATDLARRSGATLIGLCAADVPVPVVVEEGSALAAEAWQQMREDIEKRFNEIHAEFDLLTADRVKTEWRESLTASTHAVVESSRSADLIIMAASEGAPTGYSYRIANPSSVVLRAGRPLLIVANRAERIEGKKIVIAWKDTREARRAVADAMQLFVSADELTVVTVAPEVDKWLREGVNDVVAFLARHGIEARSEVVEGSGDSERLLQFIEFCHADLVVSGAYGHSRLREWVFGGVTRSMLDQTELTRFMSN